MNIEKKKKLMVNMKLWIIGVIAGFVNGFFGAGGGLIIVPMLKRFDNANSKIVHATTLGCVLFMCLSSSVIYLIDGVVDFKLFLFCLIGSLMGGVIAIKLLKNLKNTIIDLIFSMVLIIAGLGLIFL